MDRCFQSGQIPCRWAPDMGAGYGQPMFNYYSVLPYNLGEIFYLVGFSFINSVKILFFLCLLASSLFFYLFLAEFVLPASALVGALFYLIVPYRAVDIFVRGALSESWALALIPLVLWAVVVTIKRPRVKSTVLLSLSLGAFLTTHNISSMISLLIFIPFTVLMIYLYRPSLSNLKYLLFGGLLGVGMSAFFTLPILFERDLVQTKFLTKDYYDFRIHYVAFKQLFFSQHWGYGPSRPGSDDDISFAVGILQSLALVVSPFLLVRKLKEKKTIVITGFLFLFLALITIFLTHSKSVYIWDRISFLSFVQFPWRFLGLVAICTSVVAAITVELLPAKRKNILISILILFLIALNFNFFSFEKYFPGATDLQKLTGSEFLKQQKSALLDYLPVSSQVIPLDIAPALPQLSDDRVNINYFEKRSNYFSTELDIYVDNVTVTFPIVYFPGWQVFYNRSASGFAYTYDNDLGLITVKLNKGHHLIQGFFDNTPIRDVGNIVTFISFLTILVMVVISNEKNKQ